MNNFSAALTAVSAAAGYEPALGGPVASGSPASRLPPEARAKYHAIVAAAEDALALTDSSWRRVEEAQKAVMHAEVRLRGLDANNRIDKEAFGYKDAVAKAAAARETLDRLRADHEARSEAGRPARELAFALGRYCERHLVHVADITAAPPVAAPQLGKGQSHADAVRAARARLDKLRDELQAVEGATLPADIAKQRARELIAGIAERGKPNVLELLEGRRSFSFALRYIGAPLVVGPNGQPLGKAGNDGYQPDAFATLAWLFERELADAVCREIDAHADPASALDDAQIQKKRAQFTAAILQTEREEEALIASAEAVGVTIMRRPDCDPRALLQLGDDMPAPQRNAII